MKGIFIDSKDWEVIVGGDWRDKNGKPTKYSVKRAKRDIYISGGPGFYWFHKGNFEKAIGCWLYDLDIIKSVEKEEEKRFHKGLFYYQIAISYQKIGDQDLFNKYITKARKEDKKTYGKLADTFPATKNANTKTT